MNISVVIVTRGDVDLAPIIGQDWPDAVQEIVVWDNASEERRNLCVYGRYAAIAETNHELIYVQDDDCLLERDAIQGLIDRGTAGEIVCNMVEHRWFDYPDSCLVGWGAVFHRNAPYRAFDEFFRAQGAMLPADMPLALKMAADFGFNSEPDFFRTCDVVFTTLTPHVKVDLGFTHLPWAEGPDRMFKQPNHKSERDEMLELARKVRDAR